MTAAADKAGHQGHDGRTGWLEHTIAGITASIERAVFTEEHARSQGWLQAIDPIDRQAPSYAVVK